MKTKKFNKILAFLMAIGIMSYLIVGVTTTVYAEETTPTASPNTTQTCDQGMTYSEELNTCIKANESEEITIVKVNDNQTATDENVAKKPTYGYTNGTWSIINFACAATGLLIALAALVLKTHREQIDERTLFVKYYERKKSYMYCNLFIAVCGIALFILTQRITDSMVLLDEFSGMFLFFALANVVIYFVYCKWNDATSIYD